MALLLKLRPAHAFIVDHGLRPESAAEAATVQQRAASLGVPASILRWEGDKPKTGVMEAARQARYDLLLEACYRGGFTHLFLAHHQDDQIETYLMREACGSGWRGLAGMPWTAERAGVTLVRPLLDTPKAELIETCHAAGVEVVDDPSNRNPAFMRARVRADLVKSEVPHILAKMQDYRAQRQAELDIFQLLIASQCQFGEDGSVRVASVSDPVFLQNLIGLIGQQPYPVALARVEALRQQKSGTLAGVHFWRKGEDLWLVREAGRITPLELSTGTHDMLWDKRMRLALALGRPSVLAPLGEGSWRGLEEAKWIKALPGAARAALPAVWQDGQVVRVVRGAVRPYFHPFRQVFSLPFEG